MTEKFISKYRDTLLALAIFYGLHSFWAGNGSYILVWLHQFPKETKEDPGAQMEMRSRLEQTHTKFSTVYRSKSLSGPPSKPETRRPFAPPTRCPLASKPLAELPTLLSYRSFNFDE